MSTPESKGGDSFYLDRMVRNFEWNIQHDPMNYKDSVKNQPIFIFLFKKLKLARYINF